MTHQNRSNHILRRVREALGLSRPKLAQLIGCSVIYLRKIESGATPMTKNLAVAVMIGTGANYFQLLKNDSSALMDENGKPLSPSSREAVRLRTAQLTMIEVDEHIENLRFNLETLLDAAVLAPDSRFLNVARSIRQALEDIAEHFDLETQCKQVLSDYKVQTQISKFFAAQDPKQELSNAKARARRYAARAELLKAQSAKTLSPQLPAPDSGNGVGTSAASPRARVGGRYRPRS